MKETITRLIDDITKEPVPAGEGESVTFSINGKEYELDLNKKNAAKFHETMKFYTDHAAEVEDEPAAPQVRRRASSAATKSTKRDPEQLAAIREWARANGHKVSDRGRIKAEIEEAYNAAQKK